MQTNCARLEQNLTENKEIIWGLDKYDKWGVLHVYQNQNLELFDLGKNLLEKCNLDGLYLKNRFDKETKEHTTLLAGLEAPEEFVVYENDIKFLIKIKEHLDVGLFLDHKQSREIIRAESKGKDILNLFAYTGSFSIYASLGGAKTTTTVDLSSTYCKWTAQNFELNDLPVKFEKKETNLSNTIWQMDTFDFIDLAIETGEKYDIVILDPPSFSRNKGNFFSVKDDHSLLIRKIQNNLLKEKGFLFFSTNLKNFTLDPYIRAGAEKLTKETIPSEFRPYKPHQSYIFYN